jgi:hypothetical protein
MMVHSSQINCKTLNSEKKPHTSEKQNCMAAIFYIYFKYFIDKSIGLDHKKKKRKGKIFFVLIV